MTPTCQSIFSPRVLHAQIVKVLQDPACSMQHVNKGMIYLIIIQCCPAEPSLAYVPECLKWASLGIEVQPETSPLRFAQIVKMLRFPKHRRQRADGYLSEYLSEFAGHGSCCCGVLV